MRVIMVLVIGMLLGGCSAITHIPAEKGDFRLNTSYTSNVRNVAAVAISKAVSRQGEKGEYMILLPGKIEKRLHAKILADLPNAVFRSSRKGVVIPTYRVTQIYINGLNSQVDIVLPSVTTRGQLLSVYLKRDFFEWYVNRDYLWRIPLEKALTQSRGDVQNTKDVAAE